VITDYFLPAVDALGIPLGEAAILAPTWFSLFHLGRRLREYGIRIVGPGARPYRRNRQFAPLAEQVVQRMLQIRLLAQHVGARSRQQFLRAQGSEMADQPLEQVVLGPRLFGFFGVRRQQYRAGGYAITANQAGVADDHVRFVALGGMAKLAAA